MMCCQKVYKGKIRTQIPKVEKVHFGSEKCLIKIPFILLTYLIH